MENGKQTVGRRGEDEACLYLMKKGHTIVERNWRSSHLETDIITMDREGLHFVEVKSRKAPAAAEPEVNVGPKKRDRMVRAAQSYLHGKDKPFNGDMEVFFDVLTVVIFEDHFDIQYYPQAFIPIYV